MRQSMFAIEFDQFTFVDEVTPKVEIALVRALNLAVTRGRTRAAAAVREQVAFPASYLAPAGGRLKVSERAKKGAFEAVISGRDRATSLATFAKSKKVYTYAERARRKTEGVQVRVKTGSAYKRFKRAFIMKLNRGDRGLGNIGLAIRTDGEEPVGAHNPKLIGKNLWLLYGASVDQVLMSASRDGGVYEQISPELMDILEAEFNRQLDLLEV